jgi:hypothetical protein
MKGLDHSEYWIPPPEGAAFSCPAVTAGLKGAYSNISYYSGGWGAAGVYTGLIRDECLICGSTGRGRDWLMIMGRFICGDCERVLVNTGCHSPLYDFYVKGLKKMWCCTAI